jgi:carbon monoxide dehydrogenase subunit G
VPTNATIPFATGTQVTIAQTGSGQVTVAGAVGVTVFASDSATKLRTQYSAGTLIKIATNSWILIGDITA